MKSNSSRQENVQQKHESSVRLLISCRDQPGIVAEVSRFLYRQGANIVQSDQYSTDLANGTFFMRVEFELPVANDHVNELQEEFKKVADRFQMKWQFSDANRMKRMALFVSYILVHVSTNFHRKNQTTALNT